MSGQLQNGEQQFIDANGKPLDGGTVDFYIPNTTTRKNTWQDQALTILNTNPVVLDAAGRAVIWGTGSYRQILKDKNGNLVWDKVVADPVVSLLSNTGAAQIGANDGAGGAIFTNVAEFISALKGNAGSSLVGFTQAGAGAQPITVQTALREARTNVLDFMTTAQRNDVVGNFGSIDVSSAIQAAIDAASGMVRLPVGVYKIGSQIVIRGACTGLVGEGMYTTVWQKSFSGDCIVSQVNGATICNFDIEGNGATYSGAGTVPNGYNSVISHMRINGTQDSPVCFNASVGTNVGTGTYSHVSDCFLLPYDPVNVMAIRSRGIDDSNRPTCRTFTNISGGGPLVDFTGMNYALLQSSLGTTVKFASSSAKIYMNGNRLTASDNIVIYGFDHVFDGNFWAFPAGKSLSINSTASNVSFGANNPISIGGSFAQPIVDGTSTGAANSNSITKNLTTFPFNWFGTTSNYVPGNGNFAGYYRQDSRLCTTTFFAVVGTTTTIAIGTWSFQLPFKAHVLAIGHALIKSSGGVYYPAVVEVQGGSSIAYLYLMNPISPSTGPMGSTDLAFGGGALIEASISYMIAPS